MGGMASAFMPYNPETRSRPLALSIFVRRGRAWLGFSADKAHRCDVATVPGAANVKSTPLERFRATWIPVRVKKTRQNKNLEPRF